MRCVVVACVVIVVIVVVIVVNNDADPDVHLSKIKCPPVKKVLARLQRVRRAELLQTSMGYTVPVQIHFNSGKVVVLHLYSSTCYILPGS